MRFKRLTRTRNCFLMKLFSTEDFLTHQKPVVRPLFWHRAVVFSRKQSILKNSELSIKNDVYSMKGLNVIPHFTFPRSQKLRLVNKRYWMIRIISVLPRKIRCISSLLRQVFVIFVVMFLFS